MGRKTIAISRGLPMNVHPCRPHIDAKNLCGMHKIFYPYRQV